MPSPSNSRLATTLAAPFAQSTRIRRGRRAPPTASTTQSAYSDAAFGSDTTSPSAAPVGSSPCSISSTTRSSSASSSLNPSRPKSLMPLSGNGLCDAEMTAPRSAWPSRTSVAIPGVGSTPTRTAIPPADATPAASASSSMKPERRVSRPISTRGWAGASSRRVRARTGQRPARGRVRARPRAPGCWRRHGHRPCRTGAASGA